MAREIPLTRGFFAIVDDEDFDWLSQWTWHWDGGYARRTEPRADGRRGRHVSMHRQIMDAKAGEEVDHANRCGLDNRRANLRRATRAQQNVNRRPSVPGTVPFRGVHFYHGAFRVEIKAFGTRRRKGGFKSAEEAARVYDAWARELHGEFADLNFSEAA